MYHYVRPTDPELPYFRYLHLEDFILQLDYFAEQYGYLSQSEFLQSLESGEPRSGLLLTFDDALSDHFHYVWPCLQARGLWGIFYIPTGIFRTRKLLDVHRIHILLGKYGGKEILAALMRVISEDMLSHAHIEEFRTMTYPLQQNDDYTNIVKRTLNYLISYEHREAVLDQLMFRFFPEEIKLASQFYMKMEEIRQLQAGGMIIGSHTVNHPVLSKLSEDEQEKEIVDSFAFLEQLSGKSTLRTFCYPYGDSFSFTATTVRLLEESHCALAFKVEPRDIASQDLQLGIQALPRYDCNLFPYGSVRGI